MAGVNAYTGALLDGFPHVEQSLEKVFTTPQGAQVMREWFGNPGLRLLGENITEQSILLWFNICWALIELFEPRLKVRQFRVLDLTRIGEGEFVIYGEYRPYAHLGWEQSRLFVSIRDGSVKLVEGG